MLVSKIEIIIKYHIRCIDQVLQDIAFHGMKIQFNGIFNTHRPLLFSVTSYWIKKYSFLKYYKSNMFE